LVLLMQFTITTALHAVYAGCDVRGSDGRWYDPQIGRFVSEDPISLAGGTAR
jgi:RHS repeat-associated protein